MPAEIDPLTAPPPAEVPLPEAPLVRVIAQLRFPEILAVEQRDFVAPLQEVLRPTYPVLRQEQTHGVVLSPDGIAAAKPKVAWRFGDVDRQWRVSLTSEFVAIETTKYTSRSDFFQRLRRVCEALDANVGPKLIDRLGVRYIGRITGAALDDIGELVRPEVRGILGTAAATHLTSALSESLFEVNGARLLARWGCLPAGATV